MKHLPAALSLAAALCLSTLETAPAQTPAAPQFTDPANLRGERVSPRTGRELPIDLGASGLAQLLRKLNTRASILNIVAHPDDEDGGMLTLYARGFGARVADISLTRGEGGQNAMTGDFEDALGLLRTQELLSNDRYTGVDQFFGTEVDFGFSKTKSESFAKWTHDRVLYDVVRAIRLYRPLILTSTWTGGVTDGHGQHQVSGQIAQEAFLAAGDPTIFPELTAEGILPWQPLRVYARVPMQSITPRGLYDYATNQYVPAKFTNYVTGITSTTPPTIDVTIHEGTLDPLLGDDSGPLSYVQFARKGLSQQKSQIGPNDRTAPTGAFDVAYHLYGDCTQTPTAALVTPPELCHLAYQAPTARLIPAQGEALGSDTATSQRAEGPTQTLSPDLDPAFFTGIDTSLESARAAFTNCLDAPIGNIAKLIQQATAKFNPTEPQAIAPILAGALRQVSLLIAAKPGDPDPIYCDARVSGIDHANILHELRIKQVQLNNALVLALGLHLTAEAASPNVTASYAAEAKATLSQSSTEHIVYRRMASANSSGNGIAEGGRDVGDGEEPRLSSDHPIQSSCGLSSTLTPVTKPYFTRDNIEVPVYKLFDPSLRNAPATPAAFLCVAEAEYNGVRIQLSTVVKHDSQAVNFVPPDDLSVPTQARVFPNDWPSLRLSATVKPFTAITAEPILTAPTPWKLENITYKQIGPNQYTTIDPATTLGESVWQLSAPAKDRQPITVTATATYGGEPITEGFRPIGYGDLPHTNFFTPATTRIVPVDLKLPTRTRIAYLPGTGDAVPEALASINLQPTLLTVADLTPTKLAAFDTVILGVRTYTAHPDLHGDPTKALLDFARNGGNVIVQYQTIEFTAADAPYPLDLGSNEKVVDETAPVTLLTKLETGNSKLASGRLDPLLSQPNLITPADFNNWVEERGHGFLATWDPHYTALLETHDPGAPAEDVLPQSPQRGGLLTTPLGRGHWTYVAFALYRQLPEAVPGAFRLLANLLNQ